MSSYHGIYDRKCRKHSLAITAYLTVSLKRDVSIILSHAFMVYKTVTRKHVLAITAYMTVSLKLDVSIMHSLAITAYMTVTINHYAYLSYHGIYDRKCRKQSVGIMAYTTLSLKHIVCTMYIRALTAYM